jgi:hypothetical protein
MRAECGIPTRIKTCIIFPDDYPEQEPLAYEVGRSFPHIADRHFYRDGGCCLWLPAESEWNSHDPSALIKFIDQVAVFFERQLIYDADPKKAWAWGERGHGVNGYIEFLQEAFGGDASLVHLFMPVLTGKATLNTNVRCPCGKGKRYNQCHAPQIERLIRQLKRANPFRRQFIKPISS